MTFLPPTTPKPEHACIKPNQYRCEMDIDESSLPATSRAAHAVNTLWECPACGRWWRFLCRNKQLNLYEWFPVSAWDIPARRRIAAHETEMYGSPVRWWDCHPNPNRGRP